MMTKKELSFLISNKIDYFAPNNTGFPNWALSFIQDRWFLPNGAQKEMNKPGERLPSGGNCNICGKITLSTDMW